MCTLVGKNHICLGTTRRYHIYIRVQMKQTVFVIMMAAIQGQVAAHPLQMAHCLNNHSNNFSTSCGQEVQKTRNRELESTHTQFPCLSCIGISKNCPGTAHRCTAKMVISNINSGAFEMPSNSMVSCMNTCYLQD